MSRSALCCAAIALVAAGCGSSKSDNNTNTTSRGGGVVQQPQPKEPISSVIAPFNKAIEDQSCAEFAPLDFSQGRQDTTPGAPPTRSECNFISHALRSTMGLSFTHGAEYGTGALVEGPPPPTGVKKLPCEPTSQALFLLDRDGKYRFLFSNVDCRQIGTKPDAGADDGGKNAQAVVDAIRAGDCTKLAPLIHPDGSLAHSFKGDPKAACKGLVRGRILAPAIRATPTAKAELLGATRDYQFYGVATKQTYFTLVMTTPPGTSSKPPLLFEAYANTDNPNIPRKQT